MVVLPKPKSPSSKVLRSRSLSRVWVMLTRTAGAVAGGYVLEADGVGENGIGGEPAICSCAAGADDVVGVAGSENGHIDCCLGIVRKYSLPSVRLGR